MERLRNISLSLPDPFNGTLPSTKKGYYLKLAAQFAHRDCKNCSSVSEFFKEFFKIYNSWEFIREEFFCTPPTSVHLLLGTIILITLVTLLLAGLTCGYVGTKAPSIRNEIPQRYRDQEPPTYEEALRREYAGRAHDRSRDGD